MRRAVHSAALVVVGLIALCAWSRGRLSADDELAAADWAMVQTQIQRKADLIPALERVVQFAVDHERMQAALIETRVAWTQSTPTTALPAAQNLSAAVSRAVLAVENAPNARVEREFASLRYELAGTENRITAAKERYNNDARDYNARLRSPVHWLAGWLFGFRPRAYF